MRRTPDAWRQIEKERRAVKIDGEKTSRNFPIGKLTLDRGRLFSQSPEEVSSRHFMWLPIPPIGASQPHFSIFFVT
jgi:hypothetical protein